MAARNAPVYASTNILVRRLSSGDRLLLAPFAEELEVERHAALSRADEPLDAVYFPQTATVSLEERVEGNKGIEIAVVGREGLIGWPALLGARSATHSSLVRGRGGTVLRVGVGPLQAACERSKSLREALLQFVHMVMVQMSRTIASHLQHSLDRRVARWLLMRHDRLGGDVLLCQHDEIASCLSVRRASVTDQLHRIEGERLIRCKRGFVAVRDRRGLELYAGDAYGHVEDHYRRLIAPFGKADSGAPLH